MRETTYVDRDRAAAVTIGSKDLKSDMKGKRRRDFRKKREGDVDEEEDECDKETFFAQGTVFENHQKCRTWIFEFWHFQPIFVLLNVTCLVTLFDHNLQVFTNSPKLTIFDLFK